MELQNGATAARDTQLTHRGSIFILRTCVSLGRTLAPRLQPAQPGQRNAGAAQDLHRARHKPLLTHSLHPLQRASANTRRHARRREHPFASPALTPPSLVRRRRAPIVYSDEPPLPPEPAGDALPEPTAEEFDDLSDLLDDEDDDLLALDNEDTPPPPADDDDDDDGLAELLRMGDAGDSAASLEEEWQRRRAEMEDNREERGEGRETQTAGRGRGGPRDGGSAAAHRSRVEGSCAYQRHVGGQRDGCEDGCVASTAPGEVAHNVTPEPRMTCRCSASVRGQPLPVEAYRGGTGEATRGPDSQKTHRWSRGCLWHLGRGRSWSWGRIRSHTFRSLLIIFAGFTAFCCARRVSRPDLAFVSVLQAASPPDTLGLKKSRIIPILTLRRWLAANLQSNSDAPNFDGRRLPQRKTSTAPPPAVDAAAALPPGARKDRRPAPTSAGLPFTPPVPPWGNIDTAVKGRAGWGPQPSARRADVALRGALRCRRLVVSPA